MTLFLGAFSFFWHAIDRYSFRPNDEALRAAILDPNRIRDLEGPCQNDEQQGHENDYRKTGKSAAGNGVLSFDK
jgi:hypothetical protein